MEQQISQTLPRFKASELQTGKILGTGTYCTVYEIALVKLEKMKGENGLNSQKFSLEQLQRDYRAAHSTTYSIDSSSDIHDPDVAEVSNILTESSILASNSHTSDLRLRGSVIYDRQFNEDGKFDEEHARHIISKYYLRDERPRYALKKYKPSKKSEYKKKLEEAEEKGETVKRHEELNELNTEVTFLSHISHPNIIKMRGFSILDAKDLDFFLVLDRLFETLGDRIKGNWTKTHNETKKKLFGGAKEKLKRDHFWSERLIATYDLSSAFRYLHNHRIIYRDIKPENVGFDVRGDIKLFDFGMARYVPNENLGEDGCFLITPCAGTRRYMAPEVGLGKAYNLSADVFGFGILLWEIASLTTPFEKMDLLEHEHAVWKGGVRPKVKKSWPSTLNSLMEKCWSADWRSRPTFTKMTKLLQCLAYEMEGNSSNDIMCRSSHMKCKSENSWAEKESDLSEVESIT